MCNYTGAVIVYIDLTSVYDLVVSLFFFWFVKMFMNKSVKIHAVKNFNTWVFLRNPELTHSDV